MNNEKGQSFKPKTENSSRSPTYLIIRLMPETSAVL